MKCERRDFLKVSALVAAKTLFDTRSVSAMASRPAFDKDFRSAMPRRILGKTGLSISRIAFGGIVVMNMAQADADIVVAEAVERGINYFDVAPSYGDAINRLGPALKPHRDKCFLACKSVHRDRAGVQEELNNSLKILQTKYFDVYQLHAIADVEKDVHAAFGKGGAMEAILEAKRNGLIRHIGFTAHTPEAALAAMREFDFDTIMCPVNFGSHFKSDFESTMLAQANKRNMGVIAIKSMMKGAWPEGVEKKYPKCWYEPHDDPEIVRMALSWTLSQDVATALPPGDARLLRLALSVSNEIRTVSEDEINKLKTIAGGLDPVFPIKKT
jgi:aryl-alcohol dehydrogenase-like predicted oxidoreductase